VWVIWVDIGGLDLFWVRDRVRVRFGARLSERARFWVSAKVIGKVQREGMWVICIALI
jgi:hypothetical protein